MIFLSCNHIFKSYILKYKCQKKICVSMYEDVPSWILKINKAFVIWCECGRPGGGEVKGVSGHVLTKGEGGCLRGQKGSFVGVSLCSHPSFKVGPYSGQGFDKKSYKITLPLGNGGQNKIFGGQGRVSEEQSTAQNKAEDEIDHLTPSYRGLLFSENHV